MSTFDDDAWSFADHDDDDPDLPESNAAKDEKPTASAELLPCPNPWCSCPGRTTGASHAARIGSDPAWFVSCTGCGASPPGLFPSREEAIALWNTRTSRLTPGEELVIRAAVAMEATAKMTAMGDDAIEDRIDEVCDASRALLDKQPEWGKK